MFASTELVVIGDEQDDMAFRKWQPHELFVRADCMFQQIHRFWCSTNGQFRELWGSITDNSTMPASGSVITRVCKGIRSGFNSASSNPGRLSA